MSSEVLLAIERLYLVAEDERGGRENCVEERLNQHQPRDKVQRDPVLLKESLEHLFLSPL